MDIISATKLAMEEGKGITNSYCRQSKIYILPTNTKECFFVIPMGYSHETKKKTACRWNPRAKDILAQDWELHG